MEAKNIRIGNVVHFYGNRKPLIIKEINSENKNAWLKGYVVHGNGDKTAIDCLRPIPLTTDWLKDFGFGLSNFHKGWHRTTNGIEILFDIDMGCFIEMVGLDINYVHQLQNLFFALTGTELEVKQEVSV